MGFEDAVRTVVLNATALLLDTTGRWQSARAKAQTGAYTANEAVSDLVATWGRGLDAWANSWGTASAATPVPPVLLISHPAVAVPRVGSGPGGSVSFAIAPAGTVECTTLKDQTSGAEIDRAKLAVSLAGATVTVKLNDAGVLVAGLYLGIVTAGGIPIATVVAQLS